MMNNWWAGEDVAHEVLDSILSEGGRQLHRHYLEKKATPFAADAVSRCILANLQMCFVSHEEESDIENKADLEIHPNPIDYWGRGKRDILDQGGYKSRRAEDERMRELVDEKKRNQAKKSPENNKRSTKSGDVNNKEGTTMMSDKERQALEEAERKSKIAQEFIIDEEENKLREIKGREEARKAEAIAAKKRAENASNEEDRRKEALNAEMEGKNYTFDSTGRLMWIDNVDANRLPKYISELSSKPAISKEEQQLLKDLEDRAKMEQELPPTTAGKGRGKAKAKPQKPVFTDGFTRLTTEQPPISDTMKVVPGVVLAYKGQLVKGPPKGEDQKMSRAKYQEFCEAEEAGNATNFFSPVVPPPPATEIPDLPPITQGEKSQKGENDDEEAESPVKMTAGGGLSAPNTTKDWRLKRDAIGNLGRFPRYHVGLLGTTAGGGFSRCLPQPIYGATMGHGLSRSESFFFPDVTTEHERSTMSRMSTTGKSWYPAGGGAGAMSQTGGFSSSGNSGPASMSNTQNKFYDTNQSFGKMSNLSAKSLQDFRHLYQQEKREVVSMIRALDIRQNVKSRGGRMQTQNKGRAILGRNVVQGNNLPE